MFVNGYWKLVRNPFSKYERKYTIALITAILQFLLITPVALVSMLSDSPPQFITNSQLLSSLIELISSDKILFVEIIILYIVSLLKFMFNFNLKRKDRNILSNELQSLSKSLRPNLILNKGVTGSEKLSNELIELYGSALTLRRDCLKQDVQNINNIDNGITLAVIITIVLNVLRNPTPIAFVYSIIAGALILYFLKGSYSYESYDKMIELAICDMILQDLYDAKIKQLIDNNHLANESVPKDENAD